MNETIFSTLTQILPPATEGSEWLVVSDAEEQSLRQLFHQAEKEGRKTYWHGKNARLEDHNSRPSTIIPGEAVRPIANRFFSYIFIDGNNIQDISHLKSLIASHWRSTLPKKKAIIIVAATGLLLGQLKEELERMQAVNPVFSAANILVIQISPNADLPSEFFKIPICNDPLHHHHGFCLDALEMKDYDVTSFGEKPELNDILCPLTRLKIRIICIRRKIGNHWPFFKKEWDQNFEYFLKFLTTRWLVSICDTIADYGDPVEQRTALMISLFCKQEKLSQTLRLLTGQGNNIADTDIARHILKGPFPIWDGETSMAISEAANILTVFSERLWRLLEDTPQLKLIMFEIIMRMQKDRNNTILLLDQYHPRNLFVDLFQYFTPEMMTEEI